MPKRERKKAELTASGKKCQKLDLFFSKSSGALSSSSSSRQDEPPSSASSLSAAESTSPQASTSSLSSSSLSSTTAAISVPSEQPSTTSSSEQPGPSSASQSSQKGRKAKISTLQNWNFKWLKWTSEDGVNIDTMYCGVCRSKMSTSQTTQLSSDAFIRGTQNIKKDTASDHEKTKMHQDNEKLIAKEQGEADITKAFSKLEKSELTRLRKLFDWAYMVAKEELSFSVFPSLLQVEEKHGSDLGTKYRNRVQCGNFIAAIGETLRADLRNSFSKQPFYCSLLFDGSMDKTLKDREIVSIRFLGEDNKPKIWFLGLSEPETGQATDILKSLKVKIHENNLELTSCVAMAADGAATNFGAKKGVMTLLQKEMPWLQTIHCLAHRLELAVKDAFAGSFFCKEIDDIMLQLHYMFRRSAKKWSELQHISDVIGERVVKLAKGQGTRWVGHRLKAVKALRKDLRSIELLFQDWGSGERKEVNAADAAKMKGLYRRLKTTNFKLHLAAYEDILTELSDISDDLQSDSADLNHSVNAVLACAEALQKMKITPGECLKKAKEEIGECECQRKCDCGEIEKNLVSVLDKIGTSLGERFQSMKDVPVLKHSNIFDWLNVPENIDDLSEYGKESIDILTEVFETVLVAQGCLPSKIKKEWLVFLRDHHNSKRESSMRQTILKKSPKYPNLCHLPHILEIFPTSTAQVERQFSLLKRILGDWRHSLSLQMLEHLMFISTNGPEIGSFDSHAAITRWHQSCLRRPDMSELETLSGDFRPENF